MEYGAIDLHKKESQIRIVTERGEVLDRRIATTRERSRPCSRGGPRCGFCWRPSTESEWVAQHLETLGHEVIVADPNFAPMYRSAADASRPIGAMSPPWPKRVTGDVIARRIGDRHRSALCRRSSTSVGN